MPNYKAVYFRLFNRASAAIEELQRAQCEAEESIISDDSAVFTPIFGKSCEEHSHCHFEPNEESSTQGRS